MTKLERTSISKLRNDWTLSLKYHQAVICKVVTEKLGYYKFCLSWVTKSITDNEKNKRMDTALIFLLHYNMEGDDFLNHIVTCDEIWVSYVNMETKKKTVNGVTLA